MSSTPSWLNPCNQWNQWLKIQSKTLTLKNKNKIFPKFLSPSITKSYEQRAPKNAQIFDSKLHTRLIIEGVFFYSLSLPSSAANLTRNRGPKPTIWNLKHVLPILPILTKWSFLILKMTMNTRNRVYPNDRFAGVYPEFIPENCSPGSQQGNVSLLAFLSGSGGAELYSSRECSTNQPFLCKTNPKSSTPKLT